MSPAKPATTQGRHALFCRFLSHVDAVANKATSADGLKLLKTLGPQIDAQLRSVPSAAAPYFEVVTRAAKNAIDQSNMSPLATDQVAAAGSKLAKYCHSSAV